MIPDLFSAAARAGCALNPPATAESLSRLAAAFDTLPDALLELYRVHDGFDEGPTPSIRLLPIAEALAATAGCHDLDPPFLPGELALFWINDNADYAGIFASGDLAGKVFILDYHVPDGTPVYFDTESFCRKLTKVWGSYRDYSDFDDLEPDYPTVVDSVGERSLEDAALAELYLERTEPATDRREVILLAFRFLALVPVWQTASAMPLLDHPSMWVQEGACELMGRRRYRDATAKLIEVARSGQHNGRIAALLALGQINSDEAKEGLKRLAKELPPGFEGYIP